MAGQQPKSSGPEKPGDPLSREIDELEVHNRTCIEAITVLSSSAIPYEGAEDLRDHLEKLRRYVLTQLHQAHAVAAKAANQANDTTT